MTNMKQVKKLEEYHTTIQELTEKQSELLKQAQEGSAEKKITLREQETTQDLAWYEVYNKGTDCDAANALRPLYPDVFEVTDKLNQTAQEMNDYCRTELDVDPSKMSILDVIKLIRVFSK